MSFQRILSVKCGIYKLRTLLVLTTRWHHFLGLAVCIHKEKAVRFCPVLVRRKEPVAMTTRTVCSSRWESDARCRMIWRTAEQTPAKTVAPRGYINRLSLEEVYRQTQTNEETRGVTKLTQTCWWKIYAITRQTFICLFCYNVLKQTTILQMKGFFWHATIGSDNKTTNVWHWSHRQTWRGSILLINKPLLSFFKSIYWSGIEY